MHAFEHLGPKIIIGFGGSGIYITETVIWGVIVATILVVLALWSTKNMEAVPKGKQIWVELIVTFIYDLVGNTMGKQHASRFAPYMGTIIIFIMTSSMLGLFGLRPVTTDINCTFALAILTFFLVQYSGVRSMGFTGKMKHMAQPMAFMFPVKLIEECVLPVSLSFRLFGNILGGMVVMELLYAALASATAGITEIPFLNFMIPLPVNLFFDVFEPVLQAYIFTMLSMVFIAQEIPVAGSCKHN